MKLFKGQVEIKETDKIKVYQYYLEVVDKNNNQTYYENSDEFWAKREYDKNGNQTYLENSNKFWSKCEFDKNGNRIYYENSSGKIIDNRLKQFTIEKQKKKDELLDLYRLLIELKEKVAFDLSLLDREKAIQDIQDIQDISIRIYLIETELKGE